MVKKLKAIFISLSLLSGFVVADINDDIQRKQAQDRRELELKESLKERFKLQTKQQTIPKQQVKAGVSDSGKCVNIKQINTSKQSLIDTQLINDLSNTKWLIILFVIIDNNLGVILFFTGLNV
jgi:hemolysin activation/secretion protein